MSFFENHRIIWIMVCASLAALVLFGINEAGYQRSNSALKVVSDGHASRDSVSRLLKSMLEAESSHRGYLLTGDDRYLLPYEQAMGTIYPNLDELNQYAQRDPDDQVTFNALAREISRKLSEMELSLRLRRQGNEDAWKFVMFTDMGRENMEEIASLSRKLTHVIDLRIQNGHAQISQTMFLSRLGIAAVAAVALLAFYMYLRQSQALQRINAQQQIIMERERARLEEQVRERTASLSELANHLQQVREDERGYLARELHDELGALLTSAKLDVARLKSRLGNGLTPEVSERLSHLSETLNGVIALKRRIIEDLRPSSLSNLGLTSALEILTREFMERSGLEIQTNLEPVELAPTVQLTVYRMVQESLTNIGKYAKAQKVLITVHNYPTHVAVQVRDDGIGFNMSEVSRSSHGLVGMRQRVEAAGGRLTITSAPGEGTLVTAMLPCERQDEPSTPALSV